MKFFRKLGCMIVYTIFVLILGMVIYENREAILKFLHIKYHQTVNYAKDKAQDAKEQIQERLPDIN